MDRGVIQVYYGEGHGKSTAAIGNAIRIASEGKSVIIIQFLKGKNENDPLRSQPPAAYASGW